MYQQNFGYIPNNQYYNQMQYQVPVNQMQYQGYQNEVCKQQPASQLYCRMINSQEDIKVDEVPMNGSLGLFIKNNMEELYAKSWNSITGSIDTIVYKPVIERKEEQETKNEFDALRNELSSLKNELLEKIDSMNQRNQNNNRQKNVKEN